MRSKLTFVVLMLILFLSRLPGLEAMPLHNDEGLHLTRAVAVWNLHPFWEIRDGKIINQWAIALFYPQHDPVFTGRIATILVTLIGFAAGYALIKRLFGSSAAIMASALWIASPYLFFFDRLALSDSEAGALVVLAIWSSWLLAERGTIKRAILTGLTLALAALFKFTAMPFALSIAVIVLLRARYPLQRRMTLLVIAGLAAAACFVIPVAYLLIHGGDLFSIALGWIGAGSGSLAAGIGANLAMLWSQLISFGLPIWSLILAVGLILLIALKPRTGGILLLAVGLPLASIIILGHDVLPRHFVVALPAFLLLGGAGIGLALDHWIAARAPRDAALVVVSAALALGLTPFALTAYSSPDKLSVPDAVWTQYFSTQSAGYGLREAVLAFPQTIPGGTAIVASMTADSCRRANFYTIKGLSMTCSDNFGLSEITADLKAKRTVYVVDESVAGLHLPDAALNAQAQQIAVYLRPGADGQAVTLWRLVPAG